MARPGSALRERRGVSRFVRIFCGWLAHGGRASSAFPPHFQAVKLLVLAQIPPPMHGQSVMVETLVRGLPARGIGLQHVNLRLSRDAADIGRWRWGKLALVIDACLHAIADRFAHRCDTLYYVPAPAKRGALYRDWVVLLLCRPFFRRLVLHWHSSGLGEWLRTRATPPERTISRWLLGRADLAIVLAESLRADASELAPRRVAVVPNGLDAGPFAATAPPVTRARLEVLFLGLCAEEKGLFAAADAVIAANRLAANPRLRLTAAGAFPDAATRARFTALTAAHPGSIRHVGFVSGEAKRALLAGSHCLCLPTRYANEAQPLVIIEALAAGLAVVATRWRGIPDLVPPAVGRLVPPGDPDALLAALLAIQHAPPDPAASRALYKRHHTREAHLHAMAAALASL